MKDSGVRMHSGFRDVRDGERKGGNYSKFMVKDMTLVSPHLNLD